MDEAVGKLEESAKPIEIALDRCDLCGSCVGVCPPDCIILNEHSLAIDGVLCICCGLCLVVCPVGALTWRDGLVKSDSAILKMGDDGW